MAIGWFEARPRRSPVSGLLEAGRAMMRGFEYGWGVSVAVLTVARLTTDSLCDLVLGEGAEENRWLVRTEIASVYWSIQRRAKQLVLLHSGDHHHISSLACPWLVSAFAIYSPGTGSFSSLDFSSIALNLSRSRSAR